MFTLAGTMHSPAALLASSSIFELYHAMTPIVANWDSWNDTEQRALLAEFKVQGPSPRSMQELMGQGLAPAVMVLFRYGYEWPEARPLELSPHTAQLIDRERALLDELYDAPLYRQVSILSPYLGMLYLTNRTRGGPIGRHYVQERMTLLMQSLELENRYWELVVAGPNGRHYLNLPAGMELPYMLHFPDEAPKPPIIFTAKTHGTGTGQIAYIHLDSMSLFQDIVCRQCVAHFQDPLNQAISSPRIQMHFDPHDKSYYLNHGHHPSMAAREEGADYVRAIVMASHQRWGPTYRPTDLSWIDHDEHEALIAKDGRINDPLPTALANDSDWL